MKNALLKINRGVKVVLAVIFLAASAWFGAVPAAACPGCRTQGELVEMEEPETVSASLAMSWSVLFMIAVVGAVLSFLGVYLRNSVLRLENERSSR